MKMEYRLWYPQGKTISQLVFHNLAKWESKTAKVFFGPDKKKARTNQNLGKFNSRTEPVFI